MFDMKVIHLQLLIVLSSMYIYFLFMVTFLYDVHSSDVYVMGGGFKGINQY